MWCASELSHQLHQVRVDMNMGQGAMSRNSQNVCDTTQNRHSQFLRSPPPVYEHYHLALMVKIHLSGFLVEILFLFIFLNIRFSSLNILQIV